MLGAIVRALKRPIFVQEKTAVETARPLLVRGDLTDAGYPTAEAALGPRGLVELTTLVGYYGLLARQLRVFGGQC